MAMVQTRQSGSLRSPSLPPIVPKARSRSLSLDEVKKLPTGAKEFSPLAAAITAGQPLATNQNQTQNSGITSCAAPPSQHFLKDIQLDTCSDLLSIPSPPPPTNRRRFSDALRDVSNDTIEEADDKKRSRKSLCHIPTPTSSNINSKPPKSTGTMSGILVDMDDDPAATRRKKRYSIATPNELHSKEDALEELMSARKKAKMESFTPDKPPADELAELRALVREYTRLPLEQRVKAELLQSVESISGGYTLFAPLPQDCHLEELPAVSQEVKFDMFLKISNDLKFMDAAKHHEAKIVQDVTECRYERHRGQLRYFHVHTSQQISCEEYEQRYMLMLDEIDKIRSKKWADYFAKCRKNTQAARDASDICIAIQTPLLKKIPETTVQQDISAKTSPEVSDPSSDEDDKEIVDECEEDIRQCNALLPMPCRDEESSDPDIARAERKLWAAMDEALSIYSQEILDIKTAKAARKKL